MLGLTRERMRLIASIILRSLALLYGDRPVPLRIVSAMARRLTYEDELSHLWIGMRSRNADETRDGWTMHPEAVSYLLSKIQKDVPAFVLEFGSGASTLWIATLMRDLHPDQGRVRVFSIEQDQEEASSVRQHLADHGLDDLVRIHVAPLTESEIWGETVLTYGLTRPDLDALLGSARPDLVLIDGPSGPRGARFGTLPLVIDHVAPDAAFFLDDALRPGELSVGARWTESRAIDVCGVHLIGRGLLSGRVRNVA